MIRITNRKVFVLTIHKIFISALLSSCVRCRLSIVHRPSCFVLRPFSFVHCPLSFVHGPSFIVHRSSLQIQYEGDAAPCQVLKERACLFPPPPQDCVAIPLCHCERSRLGRRACLHVEVPASCRKALCNQALRHAGVAIYP